MSTVAIRFTGHTGNRIIGDYEWTPANRHVQEVDLETAADLLTYPREGQFEAVPGQSVSLAVRRKLGGLMGVSPEAVGALLGGEAPAAPAAQLTDLDGLTAERAEDLGRHGITSVGALAALDADGVAALAGKSGATRAEIAAWAKQARALGS